MADKVSPLCTTYFVLLVVADTDAATLTVLVRMTSVLLAVRVFAWAGWTGPFVLTATRMMGRTLQASTTHADFVHARMVLSLSFQGYSAPNAAGSGRRWLEPVGRKGT